MVRHPPWRRQQDIRRRVHPIFRHRVIELFGSGQGALNSSSPAQWRDLVPIGFRVVGTVVEGGNPSVSFALIEKIKRKRDLRTKIGQWGE
jgi:hypothetical protein